VIRDRPGCSDNCKSQEQLEVVYNEKEYSVSRYTNANGISNEDRHTISGYTFLIDRSVISWFSKCYSLVIMLTTKAEYVTITHVVKKAVQL
jgi:hypothetical protein